VRQLAEQPGRSESRGSPRLRFVRDRETKISDGPCDSRGGRRVLRSTVQVRAYGSRVDSCEHGDLALVVWCQSRVNHAVRMPYERHA
jgi:hypothetical protein